MPEPAIRGAFADGFTFYRWAGEGERAVCRLVTAFDTKAEHVEALLASLARHAAGALPQRA